MNANELLGLVVGLVLATPVTSIAAVDSLCGGIVGGSLNRSRLWAHANRNDMSQSEGITITAVNWKDRDPISGGCSSGSGTGNYWDSAATRWTPAYDPTGIYANGRCVPEIGVTTVWRPRYNGYFSVTAELDDKPSPPTPIDDNYAYSSIAVNAFEVMITLKLIDNTGSGKGTFTQSLWEYADPALEVGKQWEDLSCEGYKIKWSGNNANGTAINQSDSVQVEYDFIAVPEAADLNGGQIVGDLRTDSSTQLFTDVDDADEFDAGEGIDISIGAWGVGASIGWTVPADSDCAEADVGAAWGYATQDGLGASQHPASAGNHHARSSTDVGDYLPENLWWCIDLSPTFYQPDPQTPPSNELTNHPLSTFRSYDTNWVVISKQKGATVKSQWSGSVYIGLSGGKSGAMGEARLNMWRVKASVKNVRYVP